MKSNLLIDLDGTLTDPKSGIVECVQYVLETIGQEALKAKDLLWVMGPLIQTSFEILLKRSSLVSNKAIKLSSKRCGSVGMYENKIYQGVPGFLAIQKTQINA